jgi:hypothetical protein
MLSSGRIVKFAPYSLFVFSSNNSVRKALVRLIEWKPFDMIIIAAILLNSLSLAAYDYNDRVDNSMRNRYLNQIGDVFTVIFMVEAVLKILAMGFAFGKGTYFKDTWNILDFVIAVSGMVELSFSGMGGLNLKALRTLRVMRPLKSINSVPSIRRQVSTLLNSLPELFNVFLLISFIMLLFAIFGLQIFNGKIYNRCRVTEMPINATYWPYIES